MLQYFRGLWGGGSAFLSGFLAGVAASICSRESKGNAEAHTEVVWSEEHHEGTSPCPLLVVFLYSCSLSACKRRD